MKKTNPNLPFLHLAAAIALVLTLSLNTHVHKAQCLSTMAEWGGNATRIADCLADDEEETLMESETSRRLLFGARGRKTISLLALNPRRPFCDRNSYGSCISRPNRFYNNRPCDYKNTCGRDA